ncbi:hypothetical protein FACS1894189_3570 [Planctomycetales bacterium]|nr:hypothetical protein FACS1894189_3570 [Planctomycetales bacterium]
MDTIDFSYNWNQKLHNNAFTTLRLHNATKYQVGKKFEIRIKNEFLGVAELVEKQTLLIEQLNSFITYLDTGYDKEKTTEIIKTMYKNKGIDWSSQKLDFCLLVFKK